MPVLSLTQCHKIQTTEAWVEWLSLWMKSWLLRPSYHDLCRHYVGARALAGLAPRMTEMWLVRSIRSTLSSRRVSVNANTNYRVCFFHHQFCSPIPPFCISSRATGSLPRQLTNCLAHDCLPSLSAAPSAHCVSRGHQTHSESQYAVARGHRRAWQRLM
jgi:hypothetical protein